MFVGTKWTDGLINVKGIAVLTYINPIYSHFDIYFILTRLFAFKNTSDVIIL